MLMLTPPFQGPDEQNHLYRAYAISTGEWEVSTATARRGGFVPSSLHTMFTSFEALRWHNQQQTRWDSVRQYLSVPLRPERTTFVDYPNTAVYPAPVYLPAAAALWLARGINLPTLPTLWLARAAGLLCWLGAGALTLTLLPLARWLFAALLLLPMTVFIHSVVSADTVTNCLALVSIAFLLKLALGDEQQIGPLQLFVLLLLGVALATAKLVYIPLLLLGVIIPAGRFTLPGGKALCATLITLVVVATVSFWSVRSMEIYLPRAAYEPTALKYDLPLPEGADVVAQRALLAEQPGRLIRAVVTSAVDAADWYLQAYIGLFGWFDTQLPAALVVLAYCWLLAIALSGGGDQASGVALVFSQRAVCVLIGILCFGLVVFSQLLSWMPVGATTISILQGRYFIPFAPLLFLVLYRERSRPPSHWLPLLTIGGAVPLLLYSTYSLYLRYYVAWPPDSIF